MALDRRRLLGAVLCTLCCGAAAEATTELPGSTVDVEPSAAGELATGTATVIDVAPFQGTAVGLPEVLQRLPGVTVRRSGAVGSYARLAIRGMSGAQITLVVDDLPLTASTLGPADLGLYPLESFQRVEVYRGAGPSRFASGLGGVLRLVTEPPEERRVWRTHVGYGSFATRTAHVETHQPLGAGARVSASAAYQGSAGDFHFYDDRETLYAEADDRMARRRNNHHDTLVGRATLRLDGPAQGAWRVAASGTHRRHGIPGAGQLTALHAGARDGEGTLRLVLEDAQGFAGRLRAALGTDVVYAARRFTDPASELSFRLDAQRSKLVQVGVDTQLAWAWDLSHETELAPRLHVERFAQSGDAAGFTLGTRELDRTRLGLGVGFEHRWDVHAHLRLVPLVRVDMARDEGTAVSAARPVVEASPRIGALVPLGACALRANAGRFHRLATLLERYGDALTLPSPALSPERGLLADVGGRCDGDVRLAHALSLRRVAVDAALFATWASELIVLEPASQFFWRAQNRGAARVLGGEASLEARATHAELALAYTLSLARDRGGARLEGIPLHQGSLHLELGPPWARLRYELEAISGAFLDAANLRRIPARTLHDVGLASELGATGLTARLTVHNATNRLYGRVPLPGSPSGTGVAKLSDFLGYPLPGRSWFVSLSWRDT